MSQRRSTLKKIGKAPTQNRTSIAPPSLQPPVHPVLKLQQSVGNRAVARLFESQLNGAGAARPPLASMVNGALSSSSRPLDADTRAFMEARFGYDFSRVQLHTGREAADSAAAVSARAYTVGSDIVFGDGAYSPNSREGRRLIAHELTHIVQQGAGPVSGTASPDGSLYISDPSDQFERAAEATADRVLSGDPAPAAALAHTGSGSQTGSAAPAAAAVQTASLALQRDGAYVSPKDDTAAYQVGYQDGKAGQPSNPIDRVGFQYAVPYQNGYSAGQADAKNAAPPDYEYQGPSIGPALGEQQSEADREAYEKAEEQRREFLRELGQEIPEDEKPGPEEPEPEIPEIVGD